MKVINKVYNNSYLIAAICLLAGFILMIIGNTSISRPNNFASLTLAPCLLLAGYCFVATGILKKAR